MTKMTSLRTRRMWGMFMILIGIILPIALWLTIGIRVLVVSSSSVIVLFIFGALLLSGRWPQGKK